jgi:hypothetical protein
MLRNSTLRATDVCTSCLCLDYAATSDDCSCRFLRYKKPTISVGKRFYFLDQRTVFGYGNHHPPPAGFLPGNRVKLCRALREKVELP